MGRFPGSRSADVAALLAIFAIAWLPFLKALAGPPGVPQNFDLRVFVPAYDYARGVPGGDPPLWNPHHAGGDSLVAAPEGPLPAVYPLMWLFNAVAPFSRTAVPFLALHWWVCLAGLYALARALGLDPTAGVLAALVFSFSGPVAYVHQTGAVTNVVALAWLLPACGALAWAIRQARWSLAALAGAGLALATLGGHPQYVYFYGLFLVVLAFVVPGPGGAASRLGMLALAGICALVFGAPRILPVLEAAAYFSRTQADPALIANDHHVPPHYLLLALVSPAGGITYGQVPWLGWVGALGVALSLLLRPPREFPLRSFLWVSVLTLLIALGPWTPVDGLRSRLDPFYGHFRGPGRWMCLFATVAALLSGWGLTRIADIAVCPRWARRSLLAAPPLIGLSAIVFLCLAGPALQTTRLGFYLPVVMGRIAISSVIATALMVLVVWRRPTGCRALALILAAAGAEFLATSLPPWVMRSPADLARWTPLERRLHELAPGGRVLVQRLLVAADYGLRHVSALQTSSSFQGYARLCELAAPNWEARLPAETVAFCRVNHRYLPLTMLGPADIERPHVLELLDVSHVLADAPDALPGWPAPERIADPEGGRVAWLHTSPRRWGRARLVDGLVRVSREEELWAGLARATEGTPAFTAEAVPWTGSPQPASFGEVRVVHAAGDELRFALSAPRRGWLLVAENGFPGWCARVDGRETRIYRANGYMMALPVAAGATAVELRYDPPAWRAGRWLQRGGLVLAIMALVLARVRRRPPRGRAA